MTRSYVKLHSWYMQQLHSRGGRSRGAVASSTVAEYETPWTRHAVVSSRARRAEERQTLVCMAAQVRQGRCGVGKSARVAIGSIATAWDRGPLRLIVQFA